MKLNEGKKQRKFCTFVGFRSRKQRGTQIIIIARCSSEKEKHYVMFTVAPSYTLLPGRTNEIQLSSSSP